MELAFLDTNIFHHLVAMNVNPDVPALDRLVQHLDSRRQRLGKIDVFAQIGRAAVRFLCPHNVHDVRRFLSNAVDRLLQIAVGFIQIGSQSQDEGQHLLPLRVVRNIIAQILLMRLERIGERVQSRRQHVFGKLLVNGCQRPTATLLIALPILCKMVSTTSKPPPPRTPDSIVPRRALFPSCRGKRRPRRGASRSHPAAVCR